MKKYIIDMEVADISHPHSNYCLLKLTAENALPQILPGQFVQVKVENSPNTFLRRPISVHYVDREKNELWMLVQIVGDGTRRLSQHVKGDKLNVILPLGNAFSIPEAKDKLNKLLLVGGGVGTAPLLYLGKCLRDAGFAPAFLLGARSATDLVQLEEFEKYGTVYLTTEDASKGEKGFVTNHSILRTERFDTIYTCGPNPMMKAVASYAAKEKINCEVSLENTMACGIGACLCCVEKDKEEHNICVCTEGPIFNINRLSWQI